MAVVVLGPILATLSAGLLPACGASAPEPAARPNVLLISLDSTCKDLLGAYGRRPAHAPGLSPSPHLDRLAREGVLFEDASSPTSWTLPAHVSMLTGQPALVHAVDIDLQTPDPGLATLAQMLSERGYRSAGFYSGPYLDARFGFARGFERYEACYGDELAAATEAAQLARARLTQAQASGDGDTFAAASLAAEAAESAVELLSHRDASSAAVTRRALEVLDGTRADERPFFLFLHYFDPHYDYTPPAPFDECFDPEYQGALDGRDFITRPEIALPVEGDPFSVERVVSERDLEHVFSLYEGELAWTDQQVGRVLERLEELGLRQDTLVVVTADHGDEFFEHGSLGHRKTLYEEVVQVPLILRYPDVLPAGRRVSAPVSILSIVPTLLEFLSIEPEAPFIARSLVGLALRDDAPEPGGLLGRLIYTSPAVQGYGSADGTRGSVPVIQVYLTETYRKGSIKVYRRRRWVEFQRDTPMPAPVRASLEERQRADQSGEHVSWIDLARHPGEAEGHFSSDFADPRARAALQEFHDLYPKLLDLRREAGETRPDEAERRALEALGYADAGAASGHATAAFEVPPPGRAVLGAVR